MRARSSAANRTTRATPAASVVASTPTREWCIGAAGMTTQRPPPPAMPSRPGPGGGISRSSGAHLRTPGAAHAGGVAEGRPRRRAWRLASPPRVSGCGVTRHPRIGPCPPPRAGGSGHTRPRPARVGGRRVASPQAHLAALFVRATIRRRLGEMESIARIRASLGNGALLPDPAGVRFRPDRLGGVPGEWAEGRDPARVALLYLHGGGFVACSPRTHRPLTGWFARHGFRVFAPDYRLAPEHPFPAAAEDAVAAWRGLVEREGMNGEGSRGDPPLAAIQVGRSSRSAPGAVPSEAVAAQAVPRGRWAKAAGSSPRPHVRVAVAGDSAGGTLALAMMLALRDAGSPPPCAAALFSPATDLAGTGDSLRDNARRDAMFRPEGLRRLAAAYLGGADPRTPLASPLYGDLAGLPPLLLHAGEREMLRDDSVRLAERARAAGVEVELRVWPVVPHAWQFAHAFVPEARRSLEVAAAFLHRAASGAPGRRG